MGYGYYVLPDGREAGYAVEAECDYPSCQVKIDRGLGYLCGRHPNGHRDFDEPGCGNYYCSDHSADSLIGHNCNNPRCGEYSHDGHLCCGEVKGHSLPHRDKYAHQEEFYTTEDDLLPD